MAMNLFTAGYLPLEQRSLAENLYLGDLRARCRSWCRSWTTCPRSCRASTNRCPTPTSATSRSSSRCPDSWAIKQLFPIMPIHRLNERPTQHAVLGDITCDSDGKIDQFIDRRDVKRTLPLHPFNGRRIIWACSWSAPTRKSSATCTTCSATPTPSTSASTPTDAVVLDAVIKGDTVREVLAYVRVRRRGAAAASCAPTSKPPCATAASTTKSQDACCASTKRVCRATPISRSGKRASSPW